MSKAFNTPSTQFVLFIVFALLALLPITGWTANFASCSQNFYAHEPPDYLEEKLLHKTVPICFNGFATLYSGVSRTPLWSAEHLTRERLYQAEDIPRDDSFHSESRLPESLQAQLADYKSSGFDRGHLAPNADMANIDQQYDSFSLANMVPQAPKNNRQAWRNLESVTRYYTKKYGEVYVVTGAAFKGKKVVQLNNRVIVPTHLFKAIYIPETGEAGAYYAPNDDSLQVDVISIDELALRSGIDAFPSISNTAKAEALELPIKVSDIADRDSIDDHSPKNEDPLWLQILIEIIKWIMNNIGSSNH